MASIYKRKSRTGKSWTWRAVVRQKGHPPICKSFNRKEEAKDAMEARLVLQASVLFAHGMKCLQQSENAELMCHSAFYANKAMKFLKLHNETLEAINRYRRKGEQKIVVQHNLLADKAVVNNFA